MNKLFTSGAFAFLNRLVFGGVELWEVLLSICFAAIAACAITWLVLERRDRKKTLDHWPMEAADPPCHVLVDHLQLPGSTKSIVDLFLDGEEDERVEGILVNSLQDHSACTALILIGTPEAVKEELRQVHVFSNKVLLTKLVFGSEADNRVYTDPIAQILTTTFENKIEVLHAFKAVDPTLKGTMKLILLLV